MKSEDIRVGDYLMVEPGKKVIKIAAIHKKKVGYHAVANKLEWVRNGLLRPIPITTEILRKNGFVKKQEWNWWVHYGEFPLIDFLLHEDENGHYVDLMNARIMYVHQLQQIMSICGINKEIEL